MYEDPICESRKSGSVSENALVDLLRPGSVDERMGFAVRLFAERNWNCGVQVGQLTTMLYREDIACRYKLEVHGEGGSLTYVEGFRFDQLRGRRSPQEITPL